MRYNHFLSAILASGVSTVLLLSIIGISEAQVRSSPNYRLQSDSINIGGGFSSSTSYIQESTVGEIGTGLSNSSTYNLHAGYQQMQEIYLSLASTGDVVMTPNLAGITGGTSNGSTTLTVTTDNPAGYSLTIEAENSPAMQNGAETIADYVPLADPDPDFTFSITSTDAHFGFSPEGVDIAQPFHDLTGVCNAGSGDTSLSCWDGLSTSAKVIAEGYGANHPAGATTTVNFRVGIGTAAGVVAGEYTATTTVTALPL